MNPSPLPVGAPGCPCSGQELGDALGPGRGHRPRVETRFGVDLRGQHRGWQPRAGCRGAQDGQVVSGGYGRAQRGGTRRARDTPRSARPAAARESRARPPVLLPRVLSPAAPDHRGNGELGTVVGCAVRPAVRPGCSGVRLVAMPTGSPACWTGVGPGCSGVRLAAGASRRAGPKMVQAKAGAAVGVLGTGEAGGCGVPMVSSAGCWGQRDEQGQHRT